MDASNPHSELFTFIPTSQANSSTLAYVRRVETEKEGTAYGVFDAAGNQLALFGSRDAAFFAAKQHDLEPMLLQ